MGGDSSQSNKFNALAVVTFDHVQVTKAGSKFDTAGVDNLYIDLNGSIHNASHSASSEAHTVQRVRGLGD